MLARTLLCSLLVVVVVLCLATTALAGLPPTPINSCYVTIDAPGVYILTADLTCPGPDTAITIAAPSGNVSNIVLKLNSHTLTGDGTSTGIDFEGATSTLVLGPGTITGFNLGINMYASTGTVAGVTLTLNNIGLNLEDSDTATVVSSKLIGNLGPGVHAFASQVTLIGNEVSGDCPGCAEGGIDLNGTGLSSPINVLILGNRSTSNGLGAGYGMCVGCGPVAAVSGLIAGNIVEANPGSGILVAGFNGLPSNSGLQIVNNQATGNGTDLMDQSGCQTVWGHNAFGSASGSCITPPGQSQPVNACGTTITKPGSYILTADLNCTIDNAITIVSRNVLFQLNSHTISGPGPDTNSNGIQIVFSDGITVLGPGTVRGFAIGINVSHAKATVVGVTATGNGAGFSAVLSNSLELYANKADNNVFIGINASDSRTILLGNECSGNGATGIFSSTSNDVMFGNHCYNNETGIHVLGEQGTWGIFDNITDNNTFYGIFNDSAAQKFHLINNEATGNGLADMNDNSCLAQWKANAFNTQTGSGCIN